MKLKFARSLQLKTVNELKKAGLDSSKLGRQSMWQNLFAPQVASLMGGGTVRRSPRTLLNFTG